MRGARVVLGDKNLSSLRGKVIAKHSEVISAFCESAESAFGKVALKQVHGNLQPAAVRRASHCAPHRCTLTYSFLQLYRLADKNSDGALCKEDLKSALMALGFTHLSDKQIDSIFQRADADGNMEIDFEVCCL